MEDYMERIFVKKECLNRVGFDRVEFKNIGIGYDLKKLIKISDNDDSIKKLSYYDSNLNYLKIESKNIGRLTVWRQKEGYLQGSLLVNLDFSPTDLFGHNIGNLTLEDLQNAVFHIGEEIYLQYKIELDLSVITFKTCEINFNYFTKEDTAQLQKGLGHLAKEIPYMSINMKIADSRDKSNLDPKTLVAQNKQQKLSFYSKINEIKKKNKSIEVNVVDEDGVIQEGDIFRFELKLKNTAKIKKVLGTAKLFEQDSNRFHSNLSSYIEKNILKTYEKTKNIRKSKLRDIVSKYKNKNRSGKPWINNLLSEILIIEKSLDFDILVNKDELLDVVRDVFYENHNWKRIYSSVKSKLDSYPFTKLEFDRYEMTEAFINELKDQFSSLTK